MNELIENTVELVEQFNEDIKSDLSSKGIDNSKDASNSLRIKVEQSSNKINISSLGVDYIYYLDKGRGPGKFPPVKVTEDWVATKPVDINPFLVGRKIAREGTEIYKDNSKGIQLDKKREELQKTIKEQAPKWAKKDLLIKIKANKFE